MGASMFGKNSARVVITGFRPQLPASTPAREPAQCTDLLVLGQVVRLQSAPDGRPFLKRESLKRGVIHSICDTKIHFIEAKRSYDFFADDGSALTLTGKDLGQGSISEDSDDVAGSVSEGSSEVELEDNLTGRDLLQLMPPKAFQESLADHPEDAAFDEEDLKEGAYVVCRRRSKAALAGDEGFQGASVAHTRSLQSKQEMSVLAGMFGRIEKRAGFRSEPRWIVEVLPDSVPLPFLRSLITIPRGFGRPHEPALPSKVILASSEVVEVNHFFDRSGVEWTRLGEASNQTGDGEEPDTIRLSVLYAKPALPLEENLTIAQRSRMLAAVNKATIGLRLVFKNPETVAQRRTLVFEERTPDSSHGEAVPDLLRRQCFLGMDRLGNSQEKATENSAPPALLVTGVDVKVFRPKDWSQVPPSYYAIDLELLLRPNFSMKQVPLVCRFPLASIDLALVDMAQGILSGRFEVHREEAGAWPRD